MRNKIKSVSTLVGIISGGLAYWFQPYNQTTVFGMNIWLIMGIGAFLGALLLKIFTFDKPPKIALFISLGVVLTVLFRIIYDTILWDATSHNLAPFEIIFAGVVAIPFTFAGVYLGHLIRKYMKKAEIECLPYNLQSIV